NTGYLFNRYFFIAARELGRKIDDVLHHAGLRRVRDDRAEIRVERDGEAGFLADLAQRRLRLRFIVFHMALRKAPMAATGMADQKNLTACIRLPRDDRAAGNFFFQGNSLLFCNRERAAGPAALSPVYRTENL